MHLQKKYGETIKIIVRDFGSSCVIFKDKKKKYADTTERTANLMKSYDQHLIKDKINYVFVHGDRPDALAAALAASFNNIPICHIEAGDLSGSIDEALRHAISKLSHDFFVTDKVARKVLIRLGENKDNIHIIGNSSLANCPPSDTHGFKIPYDEYAILIYHPVTTLTKKDVAKEVRHIMEELVKSKLNYIVILPNNDMHNDVIFAEYEHYKQNPAFTFYSSLPFDVFTYLLKNAMFLIGNSSCGIKEAPFYHTKVIDIGIRQNNRYGNLEQTDFIHLDTPDGIIDALKHISPHKCSFSHSRYRQKLFKKLDQVVSEDFWHPQIQKEFHQ